MRVQEQISIDSVLALPVYCKKLPGALDEKKGLSDFFFLLVDEPLRLMLHLPNVRLIYLGCLTDKSLFIPSTQKPVLEKPIFDFPIQDTRFLFCKIIMSFCEPSGI